MKRTIIGFVSLFALLGITSAHASLLTDRIVVNGIECIVGSGDGNDCSGISDNSFSNLSFTEQENHDTIIMFNALSGDGTVQFNGLDWVGVVGGFIKEVLMSTTTGFASGNESSLSSVASPLSSFTGDSITVSFSNTNTNTNTNAILGGASITLRVIPGGGLHDDPIPEPTTLALMALGFAGLGYNRKRKAS